MQIHWQDKWMAIPCNGQLTMLQGLTMSVPQQLLLHIAAVATTETAESYLTPLLAELQPLLQEYSDLFEAPTSLPPSRACDHEIPLILGASPIFV